MLKGHTASLFMLLAWTGGCTSNSDDAQDASAPNDAASDASELADATLPPGIATFEDEILELRASRAAAEARLRQMLSAMTSFRDGNFSVRLPADWEGTEGRIAEAFNEALAHEDRISREVGRLSASVGKEGRLKQRMSLPGAMGDWATGSSSATTMTGLPASALPGIPLRSGQCVAALESTTHRKSPTPDSTLAAISPPDARRRATSTFRI